MGQIKQRIKRALYAFFKDELDKRFPMPNQPYLKVDNPNLVDIYGEIKLAEIDKHPLGYERSLQDAKMEMFKQVEKYIVIKSKPLVNDYNYDSRRISMKLTVAQY